MTHKIREVTTDDEGHPGFITYGTTTDSNDQGIVTYNLVIGKYQGHIPKVGTFFNFLKSVPGYFICIFTPFFILILVQARNSIKLFRKYKKEQMEEIQAEKKSLEEERVKSQAMMEQLMQMQQAMEKNGGQLPPEYLAQMQAAQSAKPPADAPQPEPQNPAPADVTKAALQPVSHEATMPQQPIQPQHAATQQHAAPGKAESTDTTGTAAAGTPGSSGAVDTVSIATACTAEVKAIAVSTAAGTSGTKTGTAAAAVKPCTSRS